MKVTCLFLVFTSFLGVDGLACITRDRCSCVFDDGSGMIDLSAIGRTDGNPLFYDQVASMDSYWYSYNPCYPFNEGTCQNSAVCQYDYMYGIYYELGSVDSAVFTYNGFTTDVTYKSVDGARTTVVTLVCDPSETAGSLQVTGEGVQTYYSMTMTAAAACKVPDSSASASSGSMSGGSVLLIIFFVTSTVYLIAGVGFNKYKHGSAGKELIPNVNFWQSLPGLIKDGCTFTLGLICRRTVYVSM